MSICVHKGRIAVYTVLVGEYDALRRPKFTDVNCDYYCFTDDANIKSDFWKIKRLDNPTGLDCSRLSRLPKILPHLYFPEYEESIYIDSNMEIRASLVEYISRYSTGRAMLCMKHTWRNCIYAEAEECIRTNKDNAAAIEQQMKHFRELGFPEHYGLTQNSVLYRKHNDESVKRVMNDWWEILRAGSKRDQLSFSFACWKNNFRYDVAPEDWLDTKYFRRYPHLGEAFVYSNEPASKLYYSKDGRFREKNSFSAKSSLMNMEQNRQSHDPNQSLPFAYRFEEEFALPEKTRKARFDPIKGFPCILKDFSAYVGDLRLTASFSNGIEIDEYVYFDTHDPQIILDIPEGVSSVVNISYDIYIFFYPDDWRLASKALQIEMDRKKLAEYATTKDVQIAELSALLQQATEQTGLLFQAKVKRRKFFLQCKEIVTAILRKLKKRFFMILNALRNIAKRISDKLKRF